MEDVTLVLKKSATDWLLFGLGFGGEKGSEPERS